MYAKSQKKHLDNSYICPMSFILPHATIQVVIY